MDTMAERLNKLREERLAREKARIETLRELNLKKYGKHEDVKNSNSNLSVINKNVKSDICVKHNASGAVKNSSHVNGSKRPISAPSHNTKNAINDKKMPNIDKKPANHINIARKTTNNITGTSKTANNHTIGNKPSNNITIAEKSLNNVSVAQRSTNNVTVAQKPATNINAARKPLTEPMDKKLVNGASSRLFNNKKISNDRVSNINFDKKPANMSNVERKKSIVQANLTRKSMAVTAVTEKPKANPSRKSLAPISKLPLSATKTTGNNSVFERLYKPKMTHSSHPTDVEKLQNDPNYLKKVIRTTGLILNKRHTVFETKPAVKAAPVRRSISAVHFKRISKNELGNCIQKWSSIGDKLNKVHLQHVNEDETINEDKVIPAVRSERTKVKFMTPIPNLNTPRPEELQARLKAWLQKRGKSLDSYHHLQCFGIHHLPHNLRFDPKLYDDENKENIAVESDSDDGSYTENMNDVTENIADVAENMNTKWRTASIVSDSVDFNESQNTTTTCSDVVNTDEVVIGALNDLTELLREGFEWEQCARWLRAVRERFPSAPHSAAYWECRAALEERRGDLPASVQCWEEAIAKGTEHSVVEANLDQLLDKFMQLKISPNSGKSRRQVDPKLVDVKNVFKSTIIRFAVQQAKLRQSNQFSPAPKYCVTPVRRSARLSSHWSGTRTPLQICSSVRQADEVVGEKLLFVPNENLHGTP